MQPQVIPKAISKTITDVIIFESLVLSSSLGTLSTALVIFVILSIGNLHKLNNISTIPKKLLIS